MKKDTLYTGGIASQYDIRDFWYSPIGRGNLDWKKGFDIESIINIKISSKDQGKSYSCGGQAWAYYCAVLEMIATGSYEERSAYHIYGNTNFVPGGGSRGRDNCEFSKKGVAKESDVPSYKKGKPLTEAEYIISPTLSKAAEENAAVSRSLSYLRVIGDMNTIADAIVSNYGCILLIRGSDNGTWRTSYPKPPKGNATWGHWVYAGKIKTEKGKKYIGIKNSWGDKVGESGWQWIGEEYFKSGFINEAWTMQWDYTSWKRVPIMKQVISSLQKLIEIYQNKLKK